MTMKKPIMCLLGLHQWEYTGNPSDCGTKRICKRHQCGVTQINTPVEEPQAFMTKTEWLDVFLAQ